MFSSINFLFLTSLAITSWVILCYFKQIEVQQLEEQQLHDFNVEFNMENAFEESLKPSCRENYDIYLNFLCIFACVYALAKITNITENYIAKHVHARFGRTTAQCNNEQQCPAPPDIEPTPQQMEPKTIEDYRVCQQNLMLQIAFLEKENFQLERKIEELQQQIYQLSSAAHNLPMGARTSKSSILNFNCNNHCSSSTNSACINTELENQLFLSKRHFQLTRQVYMNEGNVKLNFQDLPEEGGDFSKIWQKYLEMQKYAVQKSTTPPASAQMANNLPVVISTEELQTMKGFY